MRFATAPDRSSGQEFRYRVEADTQDSACEFLAARSGLSKQKIKDAMNKGAVWIRKACGPRKRLRRASTALHVGDRLELYYDPRLLSLPVPQAVCLRDEGRYSVWYKPPGLLAQGTMYGDHASLLRQAEMGFRPARPAFLVHRLDREASGLMLVAHSAAAAASLSQLFQQNQMHKRYRVQVRGHLGQAQSPIELPLDGKAAVTEFEVRGYDADADVSTADVVIKTGRLHQIRRHFAELGFPVIGDPRYGQGNKSVQGLQLVAVQLAFRCPLRRCAVDYQLAGDEPLRLRP